MRIRRFFGAVLATIVTAASWASESMQMGDGTVKGQRIHEYEISWLQCLKGDDAWTAASPLTERMVSIGDVLRLTQSADPQPGVTTESVTYFERESMAPLRMEQRALGPDGVAIASSTRVLDADGYSGHQVRGDTVTELGGSITSDMWHGGALGLPLATIDADEFPVEFASSMMSFDGTYRTIATLAGRETLTHGGEDVEALLVDVEWHHIETGDVYPPGPDASGGRYWLVADPPEGFAHVPQYRTDTYLVSALMDACPE